jgi:hypothetical protein
MQHIELASRATASEGAAASASGAFTDLTHHLAEVWLYFQFFKKTKKPTPH